MPANSPSTAAPVPTDQAIKPLAAFATAPAAASPDAPLTLLGGLSAATFLRDYWQQRPLLIRQAIPGFQGLLDAAQLRTLAAQDQVQARLVVRDGRAWNLEHGPFARKRWKTLTATTPWTVLLQDLNIHLEQADALLRQFSFVPHARMDDLMVSHACRGGGVGPHFDSYDVFLLQGPGRRRWRISTQQDMSLRPGLPLHILKNFRAEQDWVLAPGDMLYLPPRCAHEGVALDDDCFTYSVGFRAPSPQAWVAEFLMDHAERLILEGQYTDPDPGVAAHPGQLPAAMQAFLRKQLDVLHFDTSAIEDFNGRYLTEPKPNVVFGAPEAWLTPAAFRRQALRTGVRLDPRSRLLFSGDRAWCNGEAFALAPEERDCVIRLADARALSAAELSEGQRTDPAGWKRTLWPMLHQWQEDGWLHFCPLLQRNGLL